MDDASPTRFRTAPRRHGHRPALVSPPLSAEAVQPPLSPTQTGRVEELVGQLRAELLRTWAESPLPPAAADMVRVIDALDKVAAPVRYGTDETGTPLFADPLPPQLVAEIAHDLRSPLTSIIFLTGTLYRGESGEISELQRKQLGVVYGAALSIVSIASDMVESVRDGDTLTRREPIPFSIADLFADVCDLVQPMAEQKGLDLRVVSPAHDDYIGHPVALSRVLFNLAANALNVTDRGYVELSARELAPSRVEFSVRDTGPGLDTGMVEQLYRPFRAIPASSRVAFSGSGLGLSICRRLVSALGGTLRVDSPPDGGSCFCFELALRS